MGNCFFTIIGFEVTSSMLCIYGSLASLKASRVVLLTSLIMQITGGFDGYDQKYTGGVINDAVSAFITLICIIALSFRFRRYFNVDDAKKGNEEYESNVVCCCKILHIGSWTTKGRLSFDERNLIKFC